MTFSLERRLTRSRSDRMLFGVCGGLGEYFGMDPTIVRLIFVLGVLMSGGMGIPLYVILACITPEKRRLPAGPERQGAADLEAGDGSAPPFEVRRRAAERHETGGPTPGSLGDEPVSTLEEDLAALSLKRSRRDNRTLVGLTLVGIGVFFLLSSLGFFSWFSWWRQLWPLVLVGIGLALLLARRRSGYDL